MARTPPMDATDYGAIARVQVVHGRTRDRLGGDLGLEAVEGAVRVHYENVERIAAGAVRRADLFHVVARNAVIRQVRCGGDKCGEPRGIDSVAMLLCPVDCKRREHVSDGGGQLAVEFLRVGDRTPVMVDNARPLDDVVEFFVNDPGGEALVAQ